MSEDATQPNDRDERGGLPSASNMHRVRRCPGSVRAEKSIPQSVDSSKDANEGTARHSLIEIGADAESIDDSNAAYTVERAQQLEREAIRRIGMEGEQTVEEFRERRLWVHDDDMATVTSAKLDRCVIWQNTALIVDHKTLFRSHGHAKNNEQLMTQAVAVCENYAIGRVFVALIQPNLPKDQQLTIAEYSFDEVQVCRSLLLSWISASERPDAPRSPGDWCVNCRFRSRCPEAVASSLILSSTPESLATPERMAWLLDRAEFAESVIDAIRSSAKQAIASGVAVPGWELKPGSKQRKITSPNAAFAVCASVGATEVDFIKAVSVKIGDIESLYHARTGGSRKDAAKELSDKLAEAGAISVTEKAPSLQRSKR